MYFEELQEVVDNMSVGRTEFDESKWNKVLFDSRLSHKLGLRLLFQASGMLHVPWGIICRLSPMQLRVGSLGQKWTNRVAVNLGIDMSGGSRRRRMQAKSLTTRMANRKQDGS